MRFKILFAIFLIVLFISVGSFFLEHEDKHITHTVNEPLGDAISSIFLWEAMGLSVDHPLKNNTSTELLKKKLLKLPCIKSADVHYVDQTTLGIQYELRKPIAYLSIYHNICVDQDGVKFSLYPFYSPKSIPHLYCKEEEFNEVFPLYLEIFKALPEELHNSISKVDLYHALERNKGKKEIIIEINHKRIEGNHHYFLRLSPKNLDQQFANFSSLKEQLQKVYPQKISKVIDMRIPSTAYLSEVKNK